MNECLALLLLASAVAFSWIKEKLKISRGDVVEVWIATIASGATTAAFWLNMATALLTLFTLIGAMLFTWLKVLLAWRQYRKPDGKIEIS